MFLLRISEHKLKKSLTKSNFVPEIRQETNNALHFVKILSVFSLISKQAVFCDYHKAIFKIVCAFLKTEGGGTNF